MQTDIFIAGSGCAGLYCALQLPDSLKVTVITKSDAEKSDSFLAQGGICVQRDDDDFDAFFEDTLKAGHYENNPDSVRTMIASSFSTQSLTSYFARDKTSVPTFAILFINLTFNIIPSPKL